MANKIIQLKDGNDNLYPQTAGYLPGTKISLSGTSECCGVWGNVTTLRFFIPLSVPVDSSVKGITLEGGIYHRCDGASTSIADINASGMTVQASRAVNGVTVAIIYDAAPSYAKQYYPVVIQPNGLSITFS